MINKIIKVLLIILFFLLPLINSHLLDLFGLKWGFYVDGNYEFTKVMFFNIFSGIILTLFFINEYINNKKIKIPNIIGYILLILVLSTFFSKQPYTSLLGNNIKGDSLIMYLNLIGLFILFINSDKKLLKTLTLYTVFSSLFVGFIGIKEYFLPSFDYGILSNRAISTFGHPNYLALYLIIIIPTINNYLNKSKKILPKLFYGITLFICIMSLFLTKSAWGIFIYFNYLIYYCFDYIKCSINKLHLINKKYTKYIFIILYIIFLTIGILFTIKYYPAKIQSFISRFYIWETTINIIFSDIKTFFIGGGISTLENVFDGFKVKELYIFENIGFTADRSHNIFLQYFYNFGIFGFIFIVYLCLLLEHNYKNNIYYNSIIIFLVFTIFNFSSISHYLIIILFLGIIIDKKKKKKHINGYYSNLFISILLIILCFFGTIYSFDYYLQEYNNNQKIENKKIDIIVEKIKNENYINILFKNGVTDIKKTCENLIKYNNSAEKYLYCGDLMWNYNKKEAIKYYSKGLKKLPDMWNKNSLFYNNYFIKNLFVPGRFYSEKFSNLKEILKRISEN